MLAQLDVLKISYSTDLLEIIDATDIESLDIQIIYSEKQPQYT
jgi:hypothetical protein